MQTITISMRGFKIKLIRDRKVYMPSKATFLIARNLDRLNRLDVLDLGTGSGFLAILASKLGARKIYATDISERALRIAKRNAEINHVDNIEFKIGDLFDPVGNEDFDLIICNPPMTPSPRMLPRFTWGGIDGRMILDRLIEESPNHLKKGGKLLLPVVSLVGIGRSYEALLEKGFRVRVIDYEVNRFGRILRGLTGYLRSLPDSDYIYDWRWRPMWRIVLFEAVKI